MQAILPFSNGTDDMNEANWINAFYANKIMTSFVIMYSQSLLVCVGFAFVMNFLIVYCIGYQRGCCAKVTYILTFFLNIIGLILLASAAPTSRKDGFNGTMVVFFSYLFYITIKLIWGFAKTCKHMS